MVDRKSLEEAFKERIWEPLEMHRTSMEDLAGNTNAAKAYYALEDASSYEVPISIISNKPIMGAGGAIRSCTNDLAKYYTSFMRQLIISSTTRRPQRQTRHSSSSLQSSDLTISLISPLYVSSLMHWAGGVHSSLVRWALSVTTICLFPHCR